MPISATACSRTPKAAIASAFDMTVPEGLDIVVHECDATTVHLPLPPKPQVLAEGELAKTSGGGWEGQGGVYIACD